MEPNTENFEEKSVEYLWKSKVSGDITSNNTLHAMQVFDNRKIEKTLIYVQLVEATFRGVVGECICKRAQNAEGIKHLIELVFEYVISEYADEDKLFRKKKLLYLRPKQ